MTQKELMSVAEVSKYIGVSKDKVLYWINTKKLVASNVGEGKSRPRWKIRIDDVEVFLKNRSNRMKHEPSKKQAKSPVKKWF